jgi:hypothetical protein
MKTTKIFSVLSLALIFCTVTSAFSGIVEPKTNPVATNSMIRYHVNVFINNEKPICNIYLVQIVNERGQLIAPAKPYISGVSGYDFYERGPQNGKRIAVLVKNIFGEQYLCESDFFTKPVILFGPFMTGQTYRFDLYPTSQPPRE